MFSQNHSKYTFLLREGQPAVSVFLYGCIKEGINRLRPIPSSKLCCPMVYPPFYCVNLYEVLAFCFLSILSAMYLCTVTFLLFFPSLFVTFSDVLVRFSLFPVPYSFMIKIYVLGGPYLLCLDSMIYIFHRCSPLYH